MTRRAARRPPAESSPRRPASILIVRPQGGGGGSVAATLAGINAVAVAHGWIVHLFSADDVIGPVIDDFQPDLILVFPGALPFLPPRVLRQVPLVAVGEDGSPRGIPSVEVDDDAAGQAAARHLLARGARRLGAFGFWQSDWARRRVAGFRAVAREAAVPCEVIGWPDPDRPPPPIDDPYGAPAAVREWVRALPKPAAVFAGCDYWGLSLANHCRLAGVRVPEDVAIVGIDNDANTCEMVSPPLSSVALPWRRMGYEAALIGARLLRGDRRVPTHLKLPPGDVFPRRSTDVLTVDDPDVADALAVIHAHADRPLTVAALLRRVPVYQHRLERKFKALVGRRMTQEIRRVHVERAKRLLTETDLSMPEVATRSGFANASLLAVAFKRETGGTATAYRRRHRLPPT